MNTPNAASSVIPQTTAEIAAHSSVGLLITRVDKAINKNLAMSVGEFWKFHLKSILAELHEFHIDYADEAAEDEAEDASQGADPGYVEALVDYVHEGKELILKKTELLGRAFARLGYLDDQGRPDKSKMAPEDQPLFQDVQDRLAAWTIKYPDLIEEVSEPTPESTKAPAESLPANGANP